VVVVGVSDQERERERRQKWSLEVVLLVIAIITMMVLLIPSEGRSVTTVTQLTRFKGLNRKNHSLFIFYFISHSCLWCFHFLLLCHGLLHFSS